MSGDGGFFGGVANTVGNALGITREGGLFGGIRRGIFGDQDAAATRGLEAIQNQALGQLQGVNDQQTQFGQRLANQAMGNAPSIAEAQLRSAQDRNLSQQLAAARSSRAYNPALAFRRVQQQAGQQSQATNQAAAVARLQEQQQGQQQFQNYLNSLYSGASGSANALANAQIANQNNINQQNAGIMNGIASGASMIALSDERKKKNIKRYAAGGVVKSDEVDASGIDNSLSQSGKIDPSKFAKPTVTEEPEVPPSSSGGRSPGVSLKLSKGAMVPGKAAVEGDDERNDTVPAMLSPGEMVIPRTVVQQGPEAIKSFAQHLCSGGYVKKMADGGIVDSVGKFLKDQFVQPDDYYKNMGAGLSKGQRKEDQEGISRGVTRESSEDVKKRSKYSKGGIVDEHSPKAFLDSLEATSYEYKNPDEEFAGHGRQLSVMAQDLEKTAVGKNMVKDTPTGKVVDYGKGFGAMLAAQVDLNKRISELEKRKGK